MKKLRFLIFGLATFGFTLSCISKKTIKENPKERHHYYRDVNGLIVPVDSTITILDSLKTKGRVTVFDVNNNCWDCTYIQSVIDFNKRLRNFNTFSDAIDSGAYLIVKNVQFQYFLQRENNSSFEIKNQNEYKGQYENLIDSISSDFFSFENKYPQIKKPVSFELKDFKFLKFRIHSTLIYDNQSSFVLDTGYYNVITPIY